MTKKIMGEAVVEGGALVIRVAVDAIPSAVMWAYEAGCIEVPIRVTDAEAFARAMCNALNEEDISDGRSMVTVMLDEAAERAYEAGQGEEMTEGDVAPWLESLEGGGGAPRAFYDEFPIETD